MIEVIEDLNLLRELAEHEHDEERRRALENVRGRLADRDRGAKVSEAADLLGVSTPTVRAWIKAGVLEESSDGRSPQRVDVLSLADVKRIVDILRAHGHDRDLLSEVRRRLDDPDLLQSDLAGAGIEDVRVGGLSSIGHALRQEIVERGDGSPDLDVETIADLCRRFHVRRLSVFGSATTEKFDPAKSDVDFLVEFEDGADDLLGSYFGLKEELEGLLGRPVDLVMPKSLENPYFAESVKRTRRDLYAA